GIEGDAAPRVALARAADVLDGRAGRAGDGLDGEREAVLLRGVEQAGETVEVPLEIAIPVRKLPEVEDERPGAERARDPAVQRELLECRAIAREGRADRLLGVCGDDRQALEVLDHALVPAVVDRELELSGWRVAQDPAVIGEVGLTGDRPGRKERPHAVAGPPAPKAPGTSGRAAPALPATLPAAGSRPFAYPASR